ncbi:glycogen synthase [Thermomicrobiaceae bacterium CFH 74404]|uniref:Glycogen synthase n=1 Tax=Thermalbibacter longus TaxID=2951981 RepID=A0AA41WAF2_9BACT|nr:glycogen/starch synthase [Thermalbibacter longus]MCM8748646.1 glycogen synthase [Thermalbibacter longus]
MQTDRWRQRHERPTSPLVLFASVEVAPFSKVGGLGDVAGSLPVALASAGIRAVVVAPWHGEPDTAAGSLERTGLSVTVPGLAGPETFQVWRAELGHGVPVLFLANPNLFGVPIVYIEERDRERFAAFSRAVVELMRVLSADILHANDWHTCPALIWHRALRYRSRALYRQRSVLTIHNLAHQGITDVDYATALGLETAEPLEEEARYPRTINLLARGLLASDAVTTVSPRYAEEIQTAAFGEGLDRLLRQRSDHLFGILNGIDTTWYNPATDPALPGHYSADEPGGKTLCKALLQRELGLAEDVERPLIGVISRLDRQKGIDVMLAAVEGLVDLGVQLAVLGTGDMGLEKQVAEVSRRFPRAVAGVLRFDPLLARRIYAGSDMFLMPSRFEPCGIGQLIALRYGSVPIVHQTGGLADTVQEWDPSTETGNGFLFTVHAAEALLATVRRAVDTFRKPAQWKRLMINAMRSDVSWVRPALEYVRVYEVILGTTTGERAPSSPAGH